MLECVEQLQSDVFAGAKQWHAREAFAPIDTSIARHDKGYFPGSVKRPLLLLSKASLREEILHYASFRGIDDDDCTS